MKIFDQLSKEEIDLLHDAPALVTILVGGADGTLDADERNWSEKLLRARSYSGNKELQDYYRSVSEGFWVELQHQMAILPQDLAERNVFISNQLGNLNPVLAKLDHEVAFGLYKGFLGLAEEVSKASGGFLRIGAESAAEHEWVHLPMLTPVPEPENVKEDKDRFDENIWGETADR